jgi:hypothetical protein
MCGEADDRRRPKSHPFSWPLEPQLLRREAVGEFPGSDDFLYINDKKSILRWAISV